MLLNTDNKIFLFYVFKDRKILGDKEEIYDKIFYFETGTIYFFVNLVKQMILLKM